MKRKIQTIEGHKADAKVGLLRFADAPNEKIRYWLSSAFVELLKEGMEAECETEEKPSNFGPETWIKTWDGVGQKAKRSSAGFQPVPVPLQTIALQCATQITAAAIAAGSEWQVPATLDLAARFYAWLQSPSTPSTQHPTPSRVQLPEGASSRAAAATISTPSTPATEPQSASPSALTPQASDLSAPLNTQHPTPNTSPAAESPRQKFFRLTGELGLPPHEGEFKFYNWTVIGQVLGRDLASLVEVTDAEWEKIAHWAQLVRDGKYKLPKAWQLMQERAALTLPTSTTIEGLQAMVQEKAS